MLRAVLREEGKEITRENLIEVGNRLRREEGYGVLAKKALATALAGWPRSCIIDSIRHPDEVKALQASPLFHLLAIDAPTMQRFERCKARAREGDAVTIESFLGRDDLELYGQAGPSSQRVRECMAMASTYIMNSSSVGSLYDVLHETKSLDPDTSEALRPSWDSYFMRLAELASMRSSCMKRKVGAVVVRERRVLSTGYNGTPRFVLNCNEGGCKRCDAGAASGTSLDTCLCLHGEENALLEAGRDRSEGAMVYVTTYPCLQCAKKMVQCGIKEVVYGESYPTHGELAEDLFAAAGTIVRQHNTFGVPNILVIGKQ